MLPGPMMENVVDNTEGEYYYNFANYSYDGDHYAYYDWWTESTAEDNAAKNINLFLPPVHLFLGTLGNVLSSLVLLGIAAKVLTPAVYLCYLAALDTILVLFRCTNVWLAELVALDLTRKITNRSHAACQVYSFCLHLIIHLDAWMLALATLEAALLFNNPAKAHHHCTDRDRVRNVLLLAVLILVCVNAHFFWTYGLEPDYMDSTRFFCTFSTFGSHYSEYFRNIVWPIMDLLSSAVGPGCVVFASCIHVCRRWYKQRHPASVGSNNDLRAPSSILENCYLLDAGATQRFVVVCTTLGVISLVLNLPQTAYTTFEFILERTDLYQYYLQVNLNFDAQKRLGGVICESLKDVFLSCKCFVYICMWPRFRHQLRVLFRRQRKPSRNNHPQNSMFNEDSCALVT